ncbi:Serine/threonine protein phosphatase PrpC [Singulisphaera sp. GP187]|uniref:PP2C family protein-serine/threonine phosphatase n=1 Tax=Singulisphaera sp. GP187 TaxID=1882752 RepID=UPI00092773F5|nr:protein phosphatase 2C domain-containing protein [Singulisphaera sp. GP187]SIO65495.1 Serine/threonine protein phosphatase PrpC [Singulisphaera sp. GP187]
MNDFTGKSSETRAQNDPEATADLPMSSPLTVRSSGLKLLVGVVSTVGRYREHNEDNYFVPGRKSVRFDAPSPPEGSGETVLSSLDPASNVLFIVADGMGGQQAGEQASKMAVELIPRAVSRRLGSEESDPKVVQGLIRDSVADANQEILGCSGAVAEFSNMGTTVVLALFRHDRVFVAGIGDSRAYRLRSGQFEQLTEDHSLADALSRAGTITKEEVANHKFKNVLYLYLGSKDARGGPEEVRVLDVQPGDRFLLATDGLTGVVQDEELARVLQSCDDPQKAARILIDQALANDSKDNITSLVIHVVNEAARANV